MQLLGTKAPRHFKSAASYGGWGEISLGTLHLHEIGRGDSSGTGMMWGGEEQRFVGR